MADHICVCCLRRTAVPHTLACRTCAGEIVTALEELPHLALLLLLLREPGGRPATGSRGGGRAHAPLPVREDVLTILGPGNPHTHAPEDPDANGVIPLMALLSGWAWFIAYEHRAGWRDQHGTVQVATAVPAPRRHTVAGWCTWLRAYTPFALTQPWAATLHDQLTALVARCERMTGPTHQRIPVAAPCPSCDTYALVPRLDGRGARCESCGDESSPVGAR